MGLDSFPSCRLVMLALEGQMIPNQITFWNPEAGKELLEKAFILSTLVLFVCVFFFFFFTSQASFFSVFFFVCFFFPFCESLLLLQNLLWSLMVCHDGCGLMPAMCATWLAVSQDWGLFQRAGTYKYLQNRDRQPCCQLSLSDRISS